MESKTELSTASILKYLYWERVSVHLCNVGISWERQFNVYYIKYL